MTLMTEEQFDEFFQPYAGNVEGFYQAAYWTLSDELIKELIRRHLGLKPGDHVLDAGGGTGRWAMWLGGDQNVRVTVADKSEAMLDQARRNVAAAAGSRVELLHCDLHDAPGLASATFDGVISTYGVLSFLEDPQAAFHTVYRVMKPGAVGLLMSHSLSTALSSKLSRDLASPAELRELATTKVVRWAPGVPPLRVFTARDLAGLARTAGFEVDQVFGLTTLVMPGAEDFGYPYEQISPVSQALEDPEFFRAALELELAASENPDWTERAVNLMIKVRRPECDA
jgi:ubiquinone/menaquinone biosynthesis C-methylase UbiE